MFPLFVLQTKDSTLGADSWQALELWEWMFSDYFTFAYDVPVSNL